MPTRHGSTSPTPGAPHRLSRRSFLRIGALGLGGLTLPALLRAEAAAGIRSSHKSVILIYLVGGPPHQDMFDLKPDAPKEVAGPWKPTATNVVGVQICEALPRLARLMDKLVVVRSLVGNQADHDAIQVYTGHHPKKPTPSGGWPQFGSAVAKLQGPVDPSVPPFVSLSSFPNSVWERTSAKLRFAPRPDETEFREPHVPKQSLGTRGGNGLAVPSLALQAGRERLPSPLATSRALATMAVTRR
jgi:hypothetical protein